LDCVFLATIGREDELLTPVVVPLWVLAGTVGRVGKSSAILPLFFLVTVVKPSCSAIFVVLGMDCVEYAPSELISGVNLENTTLLTSTLFTVAAF
jgi:hypothetical protein